MMLATAHSQSSSASHTPVLANGQVSVPYLEAHILGQILKPGRYLGAEQGAYRKPWEAAKARMVLAFPDVYEIGASSYAIKLLYSVVNEQESLLCDRVYAPAQDMREQLKQHVLPLFGVETKRPLRDFDLIAVSLQYELNYTTVLGLLEAAQIPLRSADRQDGNYPVLLGGGPGSSNPQPLSPFLDGFMLGDGEDLLAEVLTLLGQCREQKRSRQETLERLAKVEGVYVPGVNTYASKRIVDITHREFKVAPLIPAVEAIHDRVVVEARRGCDRMCRFCQPAFINLPTREKDVDAINKQALEQLKETGYEECSLLSLSIADYSQFKHLVKSVSSTLKEQGASLSLSSQRADRFSVEVAEAVQAVRKSTLTFAPEAGTPRLRDVINKNLTDTDILNAVTSAYQSGWNKVKLYFMIGLPTETQADLDGIVDLIQKMKTACEKIPRSQNKSIKRGLEVNVTLSNFVPKPHTPFQWHPQDTMEQLQEKATYLRERLRAIRGVKANFTSPEISKLEALISKGGEDLAAVLELAYRNGAYLDAWDETKPFAKWFEALEALGVDYEAYTRERFTDPDEPLPWDGMDVGLDKAWLKTEWERSQKAASTTPCFEACSLCGVCSSFNIWPSFSLASDSESVQQERQADLALPKVTPCVSETSPPTSETATTEERHASGRHPKIHKVAPQRLRLTVEKRGDMRYTAHLDWMRLLHRVFKRSGLPVMLSQGFNPHPRVTMPPALPMFTEAQAEWVDVELDTVVSDFIGIRQRLNQLLPEGGKVLGIAEVPVIGSSIEGKLHSMDYEARWACINPESDRMIENKVSELRQQDALTITVSTKRGPRLVDLCPLVSHLQVFPEEQRLRFKALRTTDSETGSSLWLKPQWLLNWLDPTSHWQITRLGLHTDSASSSAEDVVLESVL
jgi:radical SAM-linked protein